MEAGHPALKQAFGDAAAADQRLKKHLGQSNKILTAAGLPGGTVPTDGKVVDAAAAKKQAEEAKLAANGLKEEDPANLSDAQKKTLVATKAGSEPIMDAGGHFVNGVNQRIAGAAIADYLDINRHQSQDPAQTI